MRATLLVIINDNVQLLSRLNSTIPRVHLSLRLYWLLIPAIRNGNDKDYILCKLFYEFMTVQAVLIKP